MTDLPTLLHQRAEGAQLSPVDLDAVVLAGGRRVRRRRLATYAGGLAVAGAVGAVAVLGGGGDAPRAVDPAVPVAPSATGASWFLDGRLHHDGTSTDLGLDVVTYVRTSVGFVLVDTDGVVWSWTGRGEPERVGTAADGSPRLAGDPAGTVAAWIQVRGSELGVKMVDQATGATSELRGAGDGDAAVTAVDGDRVWWRQDQQSLSWSRTQGEVPVPSGTTVLAAAAGRIVYLRDDRVLTALGTAPGDDDVVLDDSYRDVGSLSPDGALWSADADEVGVVRTSDGDPVPLDLDADFSTGYEWLDGDSLVVLAGDGDPDDGGSMTARILVCEVPEGGCTDVSGDLGTFDELEAGDFALPVGVQLG